MIKTIKHVLLEVLKDCTKPSKGITTKEIGDICKDKYPYLKRKSVNTKISVLRNERLIDTTYTRDEDSYLLHTITEKGLRSLDSYNDLYIGNRSGKGFEQYELLTGDESRFLKAVENYVFKENRWVFAFELADHFNTSRRNSGAIAHKLITLWELGFVDKKTSEDDRLVYKTKLNKSKLSTVKTFKSLENVDDSYLHALIHNFLYNENRWVSENEVMEHLKLPNYEYQRIVDNLIELRSRGLVYYLNSMDTSNNTGIPITKAVQLYSGHAEIEDSVRYIGCSTFDVIEENALQTYINYLLSLGIKQKAIDAARYNSLAELLNTEKDKKRKSEIDYLKENKFLLMEDFIRMKSEIDRLKEELTKE